MKVSILMPWRETDERRQRNRLWVEARWQAFLPGFQFCEGHSPNGPFNRAAALNDAASRANGDVFVVADADTVASKVAIEGALFAAKTGRWSLPYQVYYNLAEKASDLLLKQDPAEEFPEPHRYEYEYRLTDSVSGVVAVPRAAWELVRGFDERFVGWGGEDRAFQRSLDVLYGPCVRMPDFVMHLWHHAPETVRFQSPFWAANAELMKSYQQAGVEEMEMLVNNR